MIFALMIFVRMIGFPDAPEPCGWYRLCQLVTSRVQPMKTKGRVTLITKGGCLSPDDQSIVETSPSPDF